MVLKKRFWEIDALRGIAILMMFVFHFFWNTNFFGLTHFALYSGGFGVFQKSIAILFLFIAGFSSILFFSKHNFSFRTYFKRFSLLLGAAVLISIVSWIVFPSMWIYFGIIHLIAFSFLISLPFYKKPFSYLALPLGIIIILIPFLLDTFSFNLGYFFWLGFGYPFQTLDFYPVVPWLGVFLLGVFFGSILFQKNKLLFSFKNPNNFLSKYLCFFGRHSLLFYLTHQLVLFPLAFLLSILLH